MPRPTAGWARAYAVAAAGAAAWTLYAGKDLSWDLLHYHYYVAHAFVTGRLERDFFAASAQSYLNPLGHLVFYWPVAWGWHSAAVSVLLALAHALNVALLYRLAERLFARRAASERALLASLAAALGAASAVFLATVGTSFLDPLLTVPMLLGLLALAAPGTAVTTARAAAAGFLFGAAAALKYSNAIFAIAALAWVATLSAPVRRARAVLAYCGAALAALGAFAGPTLWHLWREYGSPVFPLFNAWFRAPDFPPINVAAERFAPASLTEALLFPLRVVSPQSMIYAEISAPDLRFAAIAVLAAACLAAWLRRALARPERREPILAGEDLRLLGFFVLACAAWLATSSNGRYGMLLVLLAGPLAALLAERLLPLAAARSALLVLLVAQLTAIALISPPRWYITDRWSERWFGYEVPERARREPALYLSVETLAMSVLVPQFHPGSSFVNLRGQHSLEGGESRVARLVERHADRVRVLGRALRLQRDGLPRADVIETYDATLLRHGFRVDPRDCFTIAWRPHREDFMSQLANVLVTEDAGAREPHLSVVSCALRPGARSAAEIDEERRMSALFERMERQCPGVFRGQTAVTERLGAEWSRSYAGLEARLETRRGALALVPFFKLTHLPLGTLAEWERGVPAALEKTCREGPPR